MVLDGLELLLVARMLLGTKDTATGVFLALLPALEAFRGVISFDSSPGKAFHLQSLGQRGLGAGGSDRRCHVFIE